MAPRTEIPRGQWRFARADSDGKVVPDARYIWLDGGFDPGRTYTVTYTTNRSPVVGAGLAATRDFASFLRYAPESDGNPAAGRLDFAYGFGVSQSGRFLRTLLYHGMNTDEQGRQVLDGVHSHIGGGRRGDFNVRHGMPSVEGTTGLGHVPPFADSPSDGYPGLLDRQRANGGAPKIIYTNTASEYWRGDGSFVHVDLHGEDIALPPEVRLYTYAGTAHSPGLLPYGNSNPLSGDTGMHFYNVLDYRPLARAALMSLDRWVAEGVEPPPSTYPRRSDGTAVSHGEALATFAAIPGASTPGPAGIRTVKQFDFGPEAMQGIARHPVVVGDAYVGRVSAVDDDGNELAGIRLPDVAVPVATYAGWNPRHPDTGGEGQILRLAGSTIPFAKTESQRVDNGDPRPSIDSRYASRDAYAAAVGDHADALIAQGHALAADRGIMIDAALARWDAAIAHGS